MQVIQPLTFYECGYLFTIHCHHYSRFLVVRQVIFKIQPPQFVFEQQLENKNIIQISQYCGFGGLAVACRL